MKPAVTLLVLVVLAFLTMEGQEPKIVEGTFKASGKCGSCKSRIEKALRIKEVKSAKWDQKSQLVSVAYFSPSITLDSLQHCVATVGHDTEKFKAPDEVYNRLPGCCLYR